MGVSPAYVKGGICCLSPAPPRPSPPSGSINVTLTTLPPEAEKGHQLRGVSLISYVLLICGSDNSVSKGSLEPAPSSLVLLPHDCIPILKNKWVAILKAVFPTPSFISGLPQVTGRSKNSLEDHFSLLDCTFLKLKTYLVIYWVPDHAGLGTAQSPHGA